MFAPGAYPAAGYGYPPQRPLGTNGFAVASLIMGILGPLGGGLLSVIFGIIALVQIRKNGQRGKGLAIGGLTLTGVWLLVIVGVAVAALAFSDRTDPDLEAARKAAEDYNAIETLKPSFDLGDCVNVTEGQNSYSVFPDIHCASPHNGEVVGVITVPDGPYPGEEAIWEEGDEGCWPLAEEYLAEEHVLDEALDLTYTYPGEAEWDDGDREIACVVFTPDKIKGSMKKP